MISSIDKDTSKANRRRDIEREGATLGLYVPNDLYQGVERGARRRNEQGN